MLQRHVDGRTIMCAAAASVLIPAMYALFHAGKVSLALSKATVERDADLACAGAARTPDDAAVMNLVRKKCPWALKAS